MDSFYRRTVTGRFAVHVSPESVVPQLLAPVTYLLILLAPTIILMLVAIPWTRYASVAPGKWMMPEMDYRYSLRDVDADVVIFGDSTGLVSLDPLVMQQDLHMNVVNVASLGSVFPVQLDDMLDHYLRYNKPPRLLVISLSPWGVRREPVTTDNSYEGIVLLVRHASWRQILAFSRAHPMVMLYFEFQALHSLLNPLSSDDPDLHGELTKHKGFAPISPPHLQQPCQVLQEYVDPEVTDGLPARFFKKYSTRQTKVLVLMAPVPDCAGSEAFRQPRTHSSWIVPSSVLPAEDIAADGRHLEKDMTTFYSHASDREIQNYLARDSASLSPIASGRTLAGNRPPGAPLR